MSLRWLLLGPLIVGGALALPGAWHAPPAVPAAPAAPAFVPQPISLDRAIVGVGTTGAQLLDRALAALAPERVTWLCTKVWQQFNDAPTEFVAEGTLIRGPGGCARLDVIIHVGNGHGGRTLRVSDGRALAEVLQHDGAEPNVTTHLIPTDAPGQDQFLRDHGCGGPRAVVMDLSQRLREIRLETGLLWGRPAIRLRGKLDAALASGKDAGPPAASACVYLDAQTLWPHRLEWWSDGGKDGPRLVLQTEFRDPEINRAPSLAECVQLFSYHPEKGP